MTAPAGRWRPWVVSALFYAGLTLVFTWPLATRLSTTLANDLGDPALNTWILWWNAHAMPLTARWWNAPIFWPAPGAFALSEVLLGLSIVTTPLQWLGAGPATAYNIAFLLTFPLSALAMHALVFTLTGRHDAATVGGLIFGFNPYRAAHFPQIQVLAAYWMPLALVGLHQFIRKRDARWLWLFGASWLLQALSNGYFLVFFPILIVLWIAWFVRDLRALGAIAAAWALASIPLVPILLKYREIHALFSFQRNFGEISFFSADVTSFLDATTLLRFWHLTAFHKPEGELFPGLTAAVLVAIAILGWLWRAPRSVRASRASLAFAAVALPFLLVALSAGVLGPWTIAWHKKTIISVTVVAKPFSIALLFLLFALACEPRIVAAVRSRSAMTFYLLAAAVLYLLALGPRPSILGQMVIYQAPYAWLMPLPGFSSLRVPARFTMVALIGLTVTAAMAFAALTERRRREVRLIAAAVVCAGVVADGWIREMPLPPVPQRLHTLESLPGDTAVLELPLGPDDPSAMYRAMYHGHPTINGYSGFFPRHYDILRDALESGDDSAIDAIDRASPSPLVVAVDGNRDEGRRWSAALAAHPSAARLGTESGWEFFRIPVQQRSADPPAARLRVATVSAGLYPENAPKTIDGDIVSRWASGGPQAGGETVTIDLGSPASVTAVTLWIGQYAGDYPHGLRIDLSEDRSTWTTVWTGHGAGLAVEGAEKDLRGIPLIFSFAPARGRWIRLTQTGTDRVHHWSIAELAVFGK